MIEHMHNVNKWFLTCGLPRELELLEERCDTEGEYLDMCNELQIYHKQTSKTIDIYSLLMHKVNCECRIEFTIKQIKSGKHEIQIETPFGDFSLNFTRDEVVYQEYINS
jgi:hypothetical protein